MDADIAAKNASISDEVEGDAEMLQDRETRRSAVASYVQQQIADYSGIVTFGDGGDRADAPAPSHFDDAAAGSLAANDIVSAKAAAAATLEVAGKECDDAGHTPPSEASGHTVNLGRELKGEEAPRPAGQQKKARVEQAQPADRSSGKPKPRTLQASFAAAKAAGAHLSRSSRSRLTAAFPFSGRSNLRGTPSRWLDALNCTMRAGDKKSVDENEQLLWFFTWLLLSDQQHRSAAERSTTAQSVWKKLHGPDMDLSKVSQSNPDDALTQTGRKAVRSGAYFKRASMVPLSMTDVLDWLVTGPETAWRSKCSELVVAFASKEWGWEDASRCWRFWYALSDGPCALEDQSSMDPMMHAYADFLGGDEGTLWRDIQEQEVP